MMKVCSPLLSELCPEDPGIIVTQSVHKQQAGFSQCSQIHKKDNHINGQERYLRLFIQYSQLWMSMQKFMKVKLEDVYGIIA